MAEASLPGAAALLSAAQNGQDAANEAEPAEAVVPAAEQGSSQPAPKAGSQPAADTKASAKAARQKPAAQQMASCKATLLFDKTLTFSDTNGQGRILVPKGMAAEHFPPIEFQSGVNVNLVDTLGNSYNLKFRYWANGPGKIYILEGTQPLQARYATQTGDTVSFGRRGDGMLVACCSSSKPERPSPGGQKQAKPRTTPKAPATRVRDPPADAQPRKRVRASGAAAPASKAHKPHKIQQLQDGVFRAIPGITSEQVAVLHLNGAWTATLDLAGEMYRAYFDTQESALEAYHAAGAVSA